MSINHWFSVPVSIEYNLKLAQDIRPIANDILSKKDNLNESLSYSAGENARITLNKTDSTKDIRLVEVKNYLFNLCKEYLRLTGYDDSLSYDTSRLFFNNLGYNGSQNSHIHNLSPVSAVFYIDVDKGSAPLVVETPLNTLNFTFGGRITNINNNNSQSIMIPPDNGTIVIAPGWLRHSVPTNYTTNRITLAFVGYYT